MRSGRVAQRAQEALLARNDPARSLQRLDDHCRQLSGMLLDQPRGTCCVVVLRHDERERRVDGRAVAGGEEEDAAVIAALEDHDRRLAGRDARERQREQVRLGARVAEPDELERRKPLADRPRERGLVAVRRAEHDAVRERLPDRLDDHRMRVPVEAGGVLAEEVDVDVPVGVGDPRTLAPHDRERERRHVDGRARVAARHDLYPLLVQPARLGIALDVSLLGSGDELRQIGCDLLAHGPAMYTCTWYGANESRKKTFFTGLIVRPSSSTVSARPAAASTRKGTVVCLSAPLTAIT